jgi:hypothetical protein
MLVRFLNFELVQECYKANNIDEADVKIEKLLEWINIHITSYVNYFGQELEKEIATFQQFKTQD